MRQKPLLVRILLGRAGSENAYVGAKYMKMVPKPGLTRLALDALIIAAIILGAVYIIVVEAAANDLKSSTDSTEHAKSTTQRPVSAELPLD